MHLRKPHSTSEATSIDMTPLIDIVFQLIAFFMFVLNFSQDLIDERVRLPLADQARPTEESPVSPVYLNIGASGEVLLAGGAEADPRTDAATIRRTLTQEAQITRLNMRAANRDPNTEGLWNTVIIRAHRDAPYGSIQRVMQIAQDTGFTKFWLRAQLSE